jgi:hypothetical protein
MELLDKSFRAYRKILYKHSNSFPFLSGDLFASKADISVFAHPNSSANPSKRVVSNAEVIYCRSDRLADFFSDYAGSINARVLLFGNSAEDFYSFEYSLPNSVKMVFLQNMGFTDRRFSCLPVGIENKRHAKNGLPSLFAPKYASLEKKNEILVGPLGKTHSEREELENLKYQDGPWSYLENRMSPKAFAAISAKYKFIAAPRGRGIDTHRFWESIYRGSIPIVKKSEWSENLSYLNIPFFQTDAWDSELLRNIIDSSARFAPNPKLIADIWWPKWESRVRTYL